jgi:DNA (cytosine-5)-methyltransferase 1
MKYIDIFAGAGGLSEGFLRAGFEPIAHVEMNQDAVHTIKTRLSYYYLKKTNNIHLYYDYLKDKMTRSTLYEFIPEKILETVIQFKMTEKNMPDLFDIIDRLKAENSIDLVVGGPPCQGYSLAGRAKQKRIAIARKNGVIDVDDERKYLYKLYCDVLKRYRPKLFVFENVVGILTADGGKHWQDIKLIFNQAGYQIEYKLLNSKDFGVPQNRKRIIIIGWRKGSNYHYPVFESIRPNWTIAELLSDLPRLSAGEKSNIYPSILPHKLVSKYLRSQNDVLTQHIARPVNDRDKIIYQIAVDNWSKNRRLKYSELPSDLKTHKNENDFVDRFKVIPSTLPYCHTILAHISKDGHYYIHYDKEQARSITVREAARIQSFPDNYFFEGSRTSAFIQIGNAVPPLMAEGIAKALRVQLLNEGKYMDD